MTALPTRGRPQALFNAFEVALGVLLVGILVRFCTVPGSDSIVQVTRVANSLPCGSNGELDVGAAVKTAMLQRHCGYRAVELPSRIPLYVLVPIGFAAAFAVFRRLTQKNGARGALLRPWVRLVLLGGVALTGYAALSITASAHATIEGQAALLDKLTDACHRATAAMSGVDKSMRDGQCATSGFKTLATCLEDDTNWDVYEAARSDKIKQALVAAKVGTPPSCELPPRSTGETIRAAITSDPPAVPPSTIDDTTHAPLDARVPAGDGGSDPHRPDGPIHSAGDDDDGGGSGVPHPEGCSAENCQAPARCDGTVCKPPLPGDKRGRHQSNILLRAAILVAAMGIPVPVAILIVTGAGDTTESEMPGSTLFDTAKEVANNPSSPAASRVIARGARRTGRFEDAHGHVRPAEADELRAQVKCLHAIQSAATHDESAGRTPVGCDAETIDGLNTMFSTAKECEAVKPDNEAARELREWVAKCVCTEKLGNLVLREIQCDLPQAP